MSEVKVNKVSPRSGTTLTIGDSGDTTNVVGTLQNNGAALVGDISSVVAGTNLSGGGTSGAVTINLADASTSAKGASSFSSDNFAASSGAITIKDLGIATAEIQDDAVTYGKMQDTATANRVLGAASAGTIGEVQIVTDMVADNAINLAKMASGTDGNIISYDTSGNPVAVATGSSGQVLTSAGAGAVPTFADAGGGAHTLISTTNISSAVSNVSITGMDSTYARYYITYTDIVNSGGATIYMRVIIGGSVQSGSNYGYGNNTRNSQSGAQGNESPSTTSWKISKSDLAAGDSGGFQGDLHIFNPSGTALKKMALWQNVYLTGATVIDSNRGGGVYFSGTAAITGVNFLASTGNLNSGQIKLYGVS